MRPDTDAVDVQIPLGMTHVEYLLTEALTDLSGGLDFGRRDFRRAITNLAHAVYVAQTTDDRLTDTDCLALIRRIIKAGGSL